MSYEFYAQIAEDDALRRRIVACAAQEGEGRYAPRWAAEHAWELPAADWVAAWASAKAGGMEEPGEDAGVVTDQMILSAVQAARTLDEQKRKEEERIQAERLAAAQAAAQAQQDGAGSG